MKPVYFIANGDLRFSANQKCEAAPAAMARQIVAEAVWGQKRFLTIHGHALCLASGVPLPVK
jgi:hypothetical protein